MNKELQSKLAKFFMDPDWVLVENILNEYIAPLKLIENVDLKQDAQAVHAELKGNLAASLALERFLGDVGMLKKRNQNPESYK